MKAHSILRSLLLVTAVFGTVPKRSLELENNPLVPISICSAKDQILLNFIKNREQTKDIIENVERQEVSCDAETKTPLIVSFQYEKSLFKAKLMTYKNEVETPENMGTVCYELSTSYMNDEMVYYECFEAGDSDEGAQQKTESKVNTGKANTPQNNGDEEKNRVSEMERKLGERPNEQNERRTIRQLFDNTSPSKSVKILNGSKSRSKERRLAELHENELPKLLDSLNIKLNRYVYGDLRYKAKNQVRIEWVNSKVASFIKNYIKDDIYTVATQKSESKDTVVRLENWYIANSLLWNFAFKLIVKEEGTINGMFSTPNDAYEISVSVFDERLMHLSQTSQEDSSEDAKQTEHFNEVYGPAIETFLSRVVGSNNGRRLSLQQLSYSKTGTQYKPSNLPFVLGRTAVSEELQQEALFSDGSFLQHSVHTSLDNGAIVDSWQKDRQLIIKSQDQISKLQNVNLPVFVLILNKFMLKEVQSNRLYDDESAAVVRGSTAVDYRLFLQRKSPLEQVGDGFQSKADTLSAEAVTTDCYFAANPNIKTDQIEINFGSFFGVIGVSDLSLDKKLLLCSSLGESTDCVSELSLAAAKQAAENTILSTGEKVQKYNNGLSFAYLFDHLYRVVFVRIWEYEDGFFTGFHVKVVTQFYTSEYLIANSQYEDIAIAVRMLLQSNIDHLQGAILDSMRAATVRFNLESLEQIVQFVVSEINEGLSAVGESLPAEFTKRLNLCVQKEGDSAIVFHQIEAENDVIEVCTNEQTKGAKVVEIVKPAAKAGVYHVKTYSLSETNKISRPVSTVYEIREKYDYDFTSTLVDYLVRTLGSYVLSSEGAKWDVEEKSGFSAKSREERLEKIKGKKKKEKKQVEKKEGSSETNVEEDQIVNENNNKIKEAEKTLENKYEEIEPEKEEKVKLEKKIQNKGENLVQQTEDKKNIENQGENLVQQTENGQQTHIQKPLPTQKTETESQLPGNENQVSEQQPQTKIEQLSQSELNNPNEISQQPQIDRILQLSKTHNLLKPTLSQIFDRNQLDNPSIPTQQFSLPKTTSNNIIDSTDSFISKSLSEMNPLFANRQFPIIPHIRNQITSKNQNDPQNRQLKLQHTDFLQTRPFSPITRSTLKASQLDALKYWQENRGLFEDTDGFLGDLELSDELRDRLGMKRQKIYV